MADGIVYTSGMTYNSNPPETARVGIDTGGNVPESTSIRDILAKARNTSRIYLVNKVRGGFNLDTANRRLALADDVHAFKMYTGYGNYGCRISAGITEWTGSAAGFYAIILDSTLETGSAGTLHVVHESYTPYPVFSNPHLVGMFYYDPILDPKIQGIDIGNMDVTVDGEYIGGGGGVNRRTVHVGLQSGSMVAGSVSSVTYRVTTENFENGNYQASVANLPTGVSVAAQVIINDNSGTLTLSGSTETSVGTSSSLTLTLDGITSPSFSLVISLSSKMVSIGTQTGTMTAGVSGWVTYQLSAYGISNGTYPATVANLPNGVTVSAPVTINGNMGTLTLSGSNQTVAGITSNLRLTIDNTTSPAFALTIAQFIKTVNVGAQIGTMTAGTAGTVNYSVSTSNITNGTYNVSVSGLPGGVTASSQVTINYGTGTLTLTGGTGTSAGTSSSLTLTLDGITSPSFSLVISATAPGTNLFNPATILTDMQIHIVTGALSASGVNRSTSAQMAVEAGGVYTVAYQGTFVISEIPYRFLNSSGNQISVSSPPNPLYPFRIPVSPIAPGFSVELVAPTGALYLQITFNNTITLSNLTVIKK